MRNNQIDKALEIVKEELNKICEEKEIEKSFVVTTVEGSSKDWIGVEVRTDGDIYDFFYDEMAGVGAERRQMEIAKKVMDGLSTTEEKYFEKYGQGIIYLF